ncbi:MAG: hypothetical protein D6788_01560 [Planctomycetota bacterium]|nr:MAG: hypothetical protein D6788_01560 [Planctomycetota bacterium]
MDRRSKILLAVFGTAVAYALFANVVYPTWIEPALKIDQRIAARKRVYDKLKRLEDRVEKAAAAYRQLVLRTGSYDVGKVETDFRARLNALIERHHLDDATVSPGRPTQDRKTKIQRLQISVTAVGTLKDAIAFLRDAAELPHLVRMGNVSITPKRRTAKVKGPTPMNLRVPFELYVLPKHKLVKAIKEDEWDQPERYVRHEDRDYSRIWLRKPFTEPIPLRAEAGRDVRVRTGQRAALRGSATGGDRQYAYSWSPSEGLSDPSVANPTVDTSKARNQVYTLTVRDGSGETATDTVHVVVTEPPKPPAVAKKPPPKKPTRSKPATPVVNRWRDRKYMQLRMTLLQSARGKRTDEVMVFDNRKKTTHYYTVGDEFDGGTLVLVHPHGGIVRRKDGYFLYPIGEWLDRDIPAESEEAKAFPLLLAAAERVKEALEQEPAKEEDAGATNHGPVSPASPQTIGPVPEKKSGKTVAEGRRPPAPAAKRPATAKSPSQRTAASGRKNGGATVRAAKPRSRPGVITPSELRKRLQQMRQRRRSELPPALQGVAKKGKASGKKEPSEGSVKKAERDNASEGSSASDSKDGADDEKKTDGNG